MKWQDISSYSKSDRDRSMRTAQLKIAGMALIVTRHIHHAPDAWVFTCAPWFDGSNAGSGTLDDAKETVLELVRERLAIAVAALNEDDKGELK